MKIISKINEKNKNPIGNIPITIAFLGDSVTQGCFECYKTGERSIETVFDSMNSYSFKLRQIIEQFYPRAPINIINAGISGDSAPSGASRVKRDIIAYKPDLTVICYGLNDSGRGIDGISAYTDGLESIFTQLKEDLPESEIIFMTPNMMTTSRSYQLETGILSEIAENCALIQNSGNFDAYIDAARKTSHEFNISVCDCYSKWKKLHESGVDINNLLANKINHPTREMHNLFAQSLFDMIIN